jgi:cysteine desulfurase
MDANATEPLRPAAREAAFRAMDTLGNPSSIHQAGRAARRILEDARESLGNRFHARPQDIVFCSGATEANALALHALGENRQVLLGATEHDAIRAAAPAGIEIPVLANGLVDLATLNKLLEQNPGALVCLMAANNETGVLHDIAGAASICAAHGALLHVDAVQAAGRCPVDWLELGAASFAISGHKAGGPMGAGALIFAPGIGERASPVQRGGGQEMGRRGGTPALPAIAGMGAAFGAYEFERIAAQRDEIAAFCAKLGAVVIGLDAPRLPNTVCLGLPGVRADTQLIALDMAGIAVSAGSACSSGKLAASHVLSAMGFSNLAGQAIRISLPWNVLPDAAKIFNRAYETMAARALRHQKLGVTEAVFAA